MQEILGDIGLDLSHILFLALISAVTLVAAYRPLIIGLFDPINIFLLDMCACAVIMFGLEWEFSAKLEFLLFGFFFWCGLLLKGRIARHHPVVKLHRNGLLELEVVLLGLCGIIVLANLYLGVTRGFPLFSSDPSISKVTEFTGGFGVVRRLNQGPFSFLCCGCMLLTLTGHKRFLAVTLLLLGCGVVMLCGSKSALAPVLFVQSFLLHHTGLGIRKSYARALRRFALPSFSIAVATAMAVVIRDNGGLAAGMLYFSKRILYYGDTILYYYPRRGAIPELAGAGPMAYLHYLFNGVLGLLRLQEYSEALGTVIQGPDTPSGFGTNAQYFVRADIFFGPAWGCLYCLVLGGVTGAVRRAFFTIRTASAVILSFVLTMAISALLLPVESSMFVSTVFDTLFLVGPLWGIAVLARMSAAPRARLSGATG